jgi:aspartyl-tRNA synthetase
MIRFLVKDAAKHIGEKVKIAGWVNVRRAHGKILFIDLRDISGVMQVVFVPSSQEVYKIAEQLRPEWVVEIEGQIVKRPEKMVNPKIETGKVEMSVDSLKVLSESETLPLSIEDSGYDIGEEVRMKYRYLDLRRERVKSNLIVRHKIIKFARDFLDKEGFFEIETPILTKSTPEGARDYVVPSRQDPGKFYALPQSPQQYKQLLMVAGLEKYFQIAKCLRDEDPRGDRQPEFTQLDLEMSFVQQEDVMELTERLLILLVKNLFPNKKIQEIPFPRISFLEAMKKYKTDRPDLRKDKNDKDLLAFCWVIDFPFFKTGSNELGYPDGKWKPTHNPFSAPKPEFMKDLLNKQNIERILTTQYDVVMNGFEIGGGSIRNHERKALEAVFEIIGYKKEFIQEKFGHMLRAFSFGAPPHGGIAWGLDRIISLLLNEPNIREVIAFPKTGDGRDFMMSAPSEISKTQLQELSIKVSKISKKPGKKSVKTKIRTAVKKNKKISKKK